MTADTSRSPESNRQGPWNHTTPVTFSPLIDWPPKPAAAFAVLTRRWVSLTRSSLFLLLA
mgnify:CR=1 FL=1